MPTYASNEDLRKTIRGMIDSDTTQKDIAARFDVSPTYLSDFLAGKRHVGSKILEALGYDKTPFYKRAK